MFDRFNAWVGSLYLRSQDLKKEDGQTFVEYALVLVVISIGVLMGVLWTGLGDALGDAIDKVKDAINPPATTP
jgi:Flp pilus assembly pilin Flp